MKKNMFLIALSLLVFGTSFTCAAKNQKALLIVAPGKFVSSLKGYAKYKSKQMPVQIVALEKVLKTSSGCDDPEKLKKYFYKEWKNNNLGYVLLVGDAYIMPVRYMVLDRITDPAYNYAFYPSDLYYADLAKQDGRFEDWNAQKDSFHAGYFGEVYGEYHKNTRINYDDIDYRPEIAVGRWPVDNKQEILNIAAKTINYEKAILNSKVEGRHKAAFVASGGWTDSRGMLDNLASNLPKGWKFEKLYYKDEIRDDKTPPVNNAEVVRILNSQVSLMLHAGHGNDDCWDGCLSTADLYNIHNEACTPIMFSAGCSTARFATLPPYEAYIDIAGVEHKGSDNGEVFTTPPPPPAPYQSGKYNPSGLGEIMLRRGLNGAVAYIGCNTGAQPCGLTLQEGFIKSFEKSQNQRLGDCWKDAVSYYFDKENLASIKPSEDWYPASIFFQAMKFMVYGDPSLKLP